MTDIEVLVKTNRNMSMTVCVAVMGDRAAREELCRLANETDGTVIKHNGANGREYIFGYSLVPLRTVATPEELAAYLADPDAYGVTVGGGGAE